MKIRCASALMNLLMTAGLCGLLPAMADEIEVSSTATANLGITLVAPQPTDRMGTLAAMARVVVPPTADRAVSALFGGTVAQVRAAAGDRVAAGDPLVDLLSAEFLALQRDYLDALGNQALAAATLARDQQLLSEGIISKRRFNEARNDAAEAQLALAEHRELLVLCGLDDDQLRALETNRQLLSMLTVRAPADGDLIERWVGAGDQVSPGARLLRLANLEQLWLEIQLPAEQLVRIARGFTVSRSIAGTARSIAQIVAVTQAVDPESQKALVRAQTLTEEHGLLPGQQIEVLINIPTSAAAEAALWQVPQRAVTRVGEQAYVFVSSPGGFSTLAVKVHGGYDDRSYVEAPLGADSRIALTGVAALKAIWLSADDSP